MEPLTTGYFVIKHKHSLCLDNYFPWNSTNSNWWNLELGNPFQNWIGKRLGLEFLGAVDIGTLLFRHSFKAIKIKNSLQLIREIYKDSIKLLFFPLHPTYLNHNLYYKYVFFSSWSPKPGSNLLYLQPQGGIQRWMCAGLTEQLPQVPGAAGIVGRIKTFKPHNKTSAVLPSAHPSGKPFPRCLEKQKLHLKPAKGISLSNQNSIWGSSSHPPQLLAWVTHSLWN